MRVLKLLLFVPVFVLVLAILFPSNSVKAAETKPTAAELKAAYTGRVVKTQSRRGYPLTMRWLSGGKYETETEAPYTIIYGEGTWWATNDASICRKIEARSRTIERCRKFIKDGGLIYAVDDNGARIGEGVKVEEKIAITK